MDDAVVVSGLAALLHPDRDPEALELQLCCDGQEYRASIEHCGDAWALLLENAHGPEGDTFLDGTRDAAIISALLAVLDTASLRHLKEDQRWDTIGAVSGQYRMAPHVFGAW